MRIEGNFLPKQEVAIRIRISVNHNVNHHNSVIPLRGTTADPHRSPVRVTTAHSCSAGVKVS